MRDGGAGAGISAGGGERWLDWASVWGLMLPALAGGLGAGCEGKREPRPDPRFRSGATKKIWATNGGGEMERGGGGSAMFCLDVLILRGTIRGC